MDGPQHGRADDRLTERCLIRGLPTPSEKQLDLRHEAGKSHVINAMHVYL